jgi:hypothetical protein
VLKSNSRWPAWLSALYVGGLVGFYGWFMWPSLFRTWFFSSDEYVMVAEVIRFLHFDFHQQFFDQPGTPLMFMATIAWIAWYGVALAGGQLPHGSNLEWFTFHHLPGLFILMRGLTFSFALISIVLLFVLASKLTNRAGASVAALILTLSPIYVSYSSFIRSESLAVCMILSAALFVLKGFKVEDQSAKTWRSGARWILLAGFAAGLGAACRFHSSIASVPLLTLMLLFHGSKGLDHSDGLIRISRRVIVCALLIAAALAVGLHTVHLSQWSSGRAFLALWPDRLQGFYSLLSSLYPLMITMAEAAALIWILWVIPFTRKTLLSVLNPQVLTLAAGFVSGVLAGTPTLLWQIKYFLQSIHMYSSSYYDLDRKTWPLFKNIVWFVRFYLKTIAPDYVSLGLLVVGAVCVIAFRKRALFPFLFCGAIFFVSKPLNLIAAPHHVICWLPFFAILAGYPVAVVYEKLTHASMGFPLAAGFLAGALGILGFAMRWGPVAEAAHTRQSEIRLQNIASATDWIHSHAQPDAVIAVSYFCFNAGTFFALLRAMDVPVPAYEFDGPRYLIWWGERSALRGLRGLACATPQDLLYIRDRLNLIKPGEGTGLSVQEGFDRVKSFGKDPAEVDIYQFDFSSAKLN